jgi:hypothetical protein
MRLKGIVVQLLVLAVTLVACELLFRKALFSGWKAVEHLRRPGLYAKQYPDPAGPIHGQDYWSLYTLLGGENQPLAEPHPLLGWHGKFNPATLVPFGEEHAGDRRPVLLFGDSFSACVEALCFEEILNADSMFAQAHYLHNFGVGGYGLDQIHLLYNEVVGRYDKPFVVLGFMTRDMERAMLQARVSPKPWFTLEADSLVLHGVPIAAPGRAWYEENKPAIPSYLWRYLRNRLLGDSLHDAAETRAYTDAMRRLNRTLLLRTLEDIRARGLDHMVLVFEPMYQLREDWRSLFFRELLDSLGVPHVFTSDIARADGWLWDYTPWEQPANGHPTDHMNRLVSETIRCFVLDPTCAERQRAENQRMLVYHRAAAVSTTAEHWMEHIRGNEGWYRSIEAEAREKGLPLDSLLWDNARYMAWKEANGQRP